MKYAREIAEKLSSKLPDTDIFIVEWFGLEEIFINEDIYDEVSAVQIIRFSVRRRHPIHGTFTVHTTMTLDLIEDAAIDLSDYVLKAVNENYDAAIKDKERNV